jgi:hypothetical protein
VNGAPEAAGETARLLADWREAVANEIAALEASSNSPPMRTWHERTPQR